jgi:Tfp pilus assembly protein FimT
MRRAFTLIELLVIVAVISVMVAVAVVSVVKGQQYARLRGTVRTVFSTVRQARARALVSKSPTLLTFSSKTTEDGVVSSVLVRSSENMRLSGHRSARSLTGEERTFNSDADADSAKAAVSAPSQGVGGGEGTESAEDLLFSENPISEEILKGICIEVVMDSDAEESGSSLGENAKRSKISIFSNADFIAGKYKRRQEDKKSGKGSESTAEDDAGTESSVAHIGEERSIVWQINGRTEPHTIYIYSEDGDRDSAWEIRVDRFGGVKILEEGEER